MALSIIIPGIIALDTECYNAEFHFSCVSIMLIVTNKPFILSVVMLNVVI
jgi:hypothetical protein